MNAKHQITVPEVALVAGTRVALGIGIGLLVADHLSSDSRRAAGWALAMFGVLTTIPLLQEILGSQQPDRETSFPSPEPVRRRAAAAF